MAKRLTQPVLSIALAFAVIACGNTSTTKTEKVEGVEWNVTVNKVVEFNDTTLGIGTDYSYTLADTARVSAALKGIKHCGNVTICWTMPSADGTIWLVAYENKPLISEKTKVREVNYIPSYGGDIQIAFKFSDSDRWKSVTRNNIGNRLAVIVNGQLMNAPKVNNEITSGNCSVTIPCYMVERFLPDIDLRNIKQ